MFTAHVTISGEFPDGRWDYIDVCLDGEFGTFDDARRWYENVYVQPRGSVAMMLHANHPELIQIEAEYNICEDGEPVDDDDWFINNAIWWKED